MLSRRVVPLHNAAIGLAKGLCQYCVNSMTIEMKTASEVVVSTILDACSKLAFGGVLCGMVLHQSKRKNQKLAVIILTYLHHLT